MNRKLLIQSKTLTAILESHLESDPDLDHAIGEIQALICDVLCEHKAAMTTRNAEQVGVNLAYHIDPTEKRSGYFIRLHESYLQQSYYDYEADGDDWFDFVSGKEENAALIRGTMYCLDKCASVSQKHAASARKLGNQINNLGLIPKCIGYQEIEGPSPSPQRRKLKAVKLTGKEWRTIKPQLDKVFETLSTEGLVVLPDAGIEATGFSDWAKVYQARGGIAAGLYGFCFCTQQSLRDAMRSSQLRVNFGCAPDGTPAAKLRVGQLVTDIFIKNGFTVYWDGSQFMPPTVYLQNIGLGCRFEYRFSKKSGRLNQ